MKKTRKAKLLAIVMAVAMAVTMTPMMAFAVDGDASGGDGTGGTTSADRLQNPEVDENGVAVWDCVYFGNYKQDKVDGAFEPAQIKWRVLEVTDTDGDGKADDAFLLADRILDSRIYQPMDESGTNVSEPWLYSQLRKWLNGIDNNNGDFKNTAFANAEWGAIKETVVGRYLEGDVKDSVSILSADDVKNPAYGFTVETGLTNTRTAKYTDYAAEQGLVKYDNGCGSYWLRADLADNTKYERPPVVSGVGDVVSQRYDATGFGVRPALHLDLTKDVWSYAGAVDSEGKEYEGRITEVTLPYESVPFTGEEITFYKNEVKAMSGNVSLAEGQDGDFVVSYKDNCNAGTATVTVTGVNDYAGVVKKNFEIQQHDISTDESIKVTLNPSSPEYDGTAKEPAAKVVCELGELTPDDDFTVSYMDNTKPGTAKAIVVGQGNYTGSVVKEFTIEGSFSATLPTDEYTYTGSAFEPEPEVTNDGTALVKDTDYTVSYEKNINAGTATVNVVGKGAYAETRKTLTFNIWPADFSQGESKAEITLPFDNTAYTGEDITPVPTVKIGDKVLTELDYAVSYQSNCDTGTAKVIVEGKGNYKGTLSKEFIIEPVQIYGGNVGLTKTAVTYNGKEQKPKVNVIVSVETDGAVVGDAAGDAVVGDAAVAVKQLVEGTDYIVIYENNKNVGKATVKVIGEGNYVGSVTKTFKINPKGTTIKAPAKLKKGFTAKWAKQSAKMGTTRITGYQVRYSLKSSMAGAKIKTVKGYAKTSVKVTKLKAKKKYYVQVRTYKTVNGVKYYSAWSAKKAVTTKK